MAVPIWTLKLLFDAGRAAWKFRKDRKRKKAELKKIRAEVPQMNMDSIGVVLQWILKLKFFKRYRAKIGAATIALSTILLALADSTLVEAFPALETLAKWAFPVGTYISAIGARYKDDTD